MKGVLALGLGLLSTARAWPWARATASAKTDGARFSIDGTTGYYAGTNLYWAGFLTNNADVDTVLSHVTASGLKILRVWGFNDVNTKPSAGTVWYQLLSASGSQINMGADGLQRLDAVVQSAEKHDVKLIINFVNNWDDYGGMDAYVKAFGGTKEGWYNNTQAQTQYKKYIKAVVSRYAKSQAIFAWELANEPRCHGCDTDVIFNWATSVSDYIRSLDLQHMITLGDEGFGLPGDTSYPYTYAEGVDFVKNLKIKNLDFGTLHMYPDSWGVPYSFGSGWLENHVAACKAAGKPCLLEEYGAYARCDIQSAWQATSLSLAKQGMGADMFWQWGDQLTTGASSNDGNTIYYNGANFTCLVTNHVAAIDKANKS